MQWLPLKENKYRKGNHLPVKVNKRHFRLMQEPNQEREKQNLTDISDTFYASSYGDYLVYKEFW